MPILGTVASGYNVSVTPTVEYLVVAGGGGGGIGHYNNDDGGFTGGGGGAGGAATGSASVTAGTQYTITVGGGGGSASTGSPSLFSAFGTTMLGGGNGGYWTGNGSVLTSVPSGNGGSSGGDATQQTVGTAQSGYGNVGGGGQVGARRSGGGGGAGAAGQTATDVLSRAGDGGIGISSSISGTSTFYAGGGGGSSYGAPGSGGSSIGGSGGILGDGTRVGGNGVINTGSGGGGSAPQNFTLTIPGGSGSSGIVIIRYPDTFIAASATTGSPTITVTGGYRIYKFTANGSITF